MGREGRGGGEVGGCENSVGKEKVRGWVRWEGVKGQVDRGRVGELGCERSGGEGG